MKLFKLLTTLLILFSSKVWATYYYVSSTKGSDSYNGRYENFVTGADGPFKTLAKAASVAVAGDQVYIRAGEYGNEQVVFPNSGTATNPIKFIGYKSYAGDSPILVNTATPTTTFNTIAMPTFTGSSRTVGTAFNLTNRQYIILENFQIRNYEYGVITGGTSGQGNLTLKNINVMTLGKTTGSDYSGKGIQLGSMGTTSSNNNTIANCLVINAAAEAMGINGNYNVVTGCKIFCTDSVGNGPSDYYIIVCGSNNTVNSCYAYRQPGLSHGGHGIGVKTTAEQTVDKGLSDALTIPATYNTFNNCTSVNIGEGFYVRHRKAQYNKFYHCNAIGTYVSGEVSGEGYGIEIRDGASYNTFDGCTATNCNTGLTFEDTVEDGDRGATSPGHPSFSNTIINGVFINCYIGIYSNGSLNGGTVAEAGNNTIAGCTFRKISYIYVPSARMRYLKNIGNIYHTGVFRVGTYSSDLALNNGNSLFKQNDFYALTSLPSGWTGTAEANINANPLFVSTNAPYNLHLQSGSPCINKVDNLTYNTKDYDNKARPNGTKSDMGAYEYYVTAKNEEVEQISEVFEKSTETLNVYPNPSNGHINLSANLDQSHTVYVLNVLGQPVYQHVYASTIDLSGLQPGIYFLEVLSTTGEKVAVKKISIE